MHVGTSYSVFVFSFSPFFIKSCMMRCSSRSPMYIGLVLTSTGLSARPISFAYELVIHFFGGMLLRFEFGGFDVGGGGTVA